MKTIIIALVCSVISGFTGYYISSHLTERKVGALWARHEAINTVLPAQVLFSIETGKVDDSIPWLKSDICGRLLAVGHVLDKYPDLKADQKIRDSLSLPYLYAEKKSMSYCDGDYPQADQVMELGNVETTYSDYLEKYNRAPAATESDLDL